MGRTLNLTLTIRVICHLFPLFLSLGCLPPNTIRYKVTTVNVIWWKEVEDCTKKSKPISKFDFLLWNGKGHLASHGELSDATFIIPDVFIFMPSAVLDKDIFQHEAAHGITQSGDNEHQWWVLALCPNIKYWWSLPPNPYE